MESKRKHDAVSCLGCAVEYLPEHGRPGCPACGHSGWLAVTIPPPPPDQVTSCYLEWFVDPLAHAHAA
jgi:hypothetical protein